MAVYGGDVGLDEFAKHPNAELLWQTAQGRVTWAGDLAVWSSHDGEDTLFNQFAREARACCSADLQSAVSQTSGLPAPDSSSSPSLLIKTIENQKSKIKNPHGPWNLYFRVTMPDAVELGLLDIINRVQDSHLTSDQFLADCRARAGSEEIFEQSYMCNPLGAATASIVEWSAIERCRFDYQIERIHLESDQILQHFGEFNPRTEPERQDKIERFIRSSFPALLSPSSSSSPHHSALRTPHSAFRIGFDVAASGQGNLSAFYIDEPQGALLWLRGLLTARTEDWHFLKTVLFFFLRNLRNLQASGDESGLGRQIRRRPRCMTPNRNLNRNPPRRRPRNRIYTSPPSPPPLHRSTTPSLHHSISP